MCRYYLPKKLWKPSAAWPEDIRAMSSRHQDICTAFCRARCAAYASEDCCASHKLFVVWTDSVSREGTVLHGESSKRLATPRNTKDKITYNNPKELCNQSPEPLWLGQSTANSCMPMLLQRPHVTVMVSVPVVPCVVIRKEGISAGLSNPQ